MGAKRPNLLGDLDDLINPAPAREYDVDADAFGEGAVLEARDEELEALASRPGRAPKGRRLMPDIALEGGAYGGRRTTRAQAFADDSGEEEEEGSDDEGRIEKAFHDATEHGSEFGSDDGSEAGSEDGSEAGSEDASDDAPSPSAREEQRALEAEYERLRAEDERQTAGLLQRADREQRKALAVKGQKRTWNGALETRIILQKALVGGNKLPQGYLLTAATQLSPPIATARSQAAAEARAALSELLGALGASLAPLRQVTGGDADETEASAPASLPLDARPEDAWAAVEAAREFAQPLVERAIDQWHRKVVLAQAVAEHGELKALQQSVGEQVALLMADADRLVARARCSRFQVQPLGHPRARPLETRAPEDEDEHVAQASGTMDVSTLDPETFDDSEFYSFLLKEFIESSGNTDASLYSVPKKRKVVDHRASKGRKLRYHVHQKLVNFMAPVEVEEPAFADQLFSNLFGGEGLTA